jgi:hypothetical protein
VTTRFDVASVRAAWNGATLGPLSRSVEDARPGAVSQSGKSP